MTHAVADTPTPRPVSSRIFQTLIFRHCTYFSRFPAGFCFPLSFLCDIPDADWSSSLQEKKRELGQNRMNIWFSAESRTRILILSCAKFIVAKYSERHSGWLPFGRNAHLFLFPPKCQTKWMKCGSRWKTFRLFVYGLCFFLFRFVECGRACIGSLCNSSTHIPLPMYLVSLVRAANWHEFGFFAISCNRK